MSTMSSADTFRIAAVLAPLTTTASPAVLARYADAGLAAVRADLAALTGPATATQVTLSVTADMLAALRGFIPQPATTGKAIRP